jgi:hypothetical protein
LREWSWAGATERKTTNRGGRERLEATKKFVEDLIIMLFFTVINVRQSDVSVKNVMENKPPFNLENLIQSGQERIVASQLEKILRPAAKTIISLNKGRWTRMISPCGLVPK